MKKGFTLIELIIVIVLIGIIGTSVTLISLNDNKEQEEVFNKLVEAASVYLSVEKDEQGNTYETGLLSGGTGVTIPIKVLKEKGYIDDSLIKTLEKDNNFDIKKSYLLAAIYKAQDSECDGETMITFKGDWNVSSTKPSYVCPYSTAQRIENISLTSLIDNLKYDVNLDKVAISNSYYEQLDDVINGKDKDGNDITINKQDLFAPNENGLFFLWNQDFKSYYIDNYQYYPNIGSGQMSKRYYYYRGDVDNNYLEYGEKNGIPLKWRILWIDEEKHMKLILNEEIPIKLTNKNGVEYVVQKGDVFNYLEYIYDNDKYDYVSDYDSSDTFPLNYWFKNPEQEKVSCYNWHNGGGTPNGNCSGFFEPWYEINLKYDDNILYAKEEIPIKNSSDGNYNSSIYSEDNFFNFYVNKWYDLVSFDNEKNVKLDEKNICENQFFQDNFYGYNYGAQQTYNIYYDCVFSSNWTGYQYTLKENYMSKEISLPLYTEIIRAGLSFNLDNNKYDYGYYDNVSSNYKSFLLNNPDNSYVIGEVAGTQNSTNKKITDYFYVNNYGIYKDNFYEIFSQASNSDSMTPFQLFKVINKDSNDIIYANIYDCYGCSNSYYKYHTLKFNANTIKPTITLDLSDSKLSGNGTENNPYKILKN